MDILKTEISNLESSITLIDQYSRSGQAYTREQLQFLTSDINNIPINQNGEVIFTDLVKILGLNETLSLLKSSIEPLLLIDKEYTSLKTQYSMLKQMVYGTVQSDKVKPFEEVVDNEDFIDNIDNVGYYLNVANNTFILSKEFKEQFMSILSNYPEDNEGNIIINLDEISIIVADLKITYINPEEYANVEPSENNKKASYLIKILESFESIKYLNETQKNIFWYHFNTSGIEKAFGYIKALQDYINNQIGMEKAYKYLLEFSKDGHMDLPENLSLFIEGFKAGTFNMLDGVLSLMNSDGVKSAEQYETLYLLQILMGDEYTIDNLLNLTSNPNSTRSQIADFTKFCEVSKGLGDGFWRWLAPHSYQVGSTIGYMALPILLNIALPHSGSALLFLGSMGNAVEQSHQTMGELTWKSYLYGAMTAAAEVVMERFGGLPGFTPQKLSFLRSLIQESSQEFFQTFINGAIDSTHFNTEYDLTELGPEALKGAIYGLITAGFFSGPGALTSKILTIKYKNNSGEVETKLFSIEEALPIMEEQYLTTQLNIENISDLSFTEAQNRAYNFLFNLGQTNPKLLVDALNLQSGQKLSKTEYKQAVLDVQTFFNNNNFQTFVDIYNNGIKTGDRFAFFRGYEEHNFIHVLRVAYETVNTAEKVYKLAELLKSRGQTLAISEINPQTLFLAGLSHDMGMKIENSIYYNQIEHKFELIEDAKYKIKEINKEYVRIEFKDAADREDYLGDLTRKNHSLNSAIEVAKHGEIYENDLELVVCLAFLHSKSNSGVKNDVSSPAELSLMIDTLYRYSQQVGVDFKFDITKIVSSIEKNSDGKYIYTFIPQIINQLSLGSVALRAGDAHALKTGNNHSGNTIVVNPDSVIRYDKETYKDIITNIRSKLETLRKQKNYINDDGTVWKDEFIIHDQLCLYEGSQAEIYIETDQGDLKLGSTDANNYTKRIIIGEANVGQPVVGVDLEKGRLTYTIEVHNTVAPYSTWTHGIQEKFGEYASFKFIPQSVIIELPVDSSLDLIKYYEAQANIVNDKYKTNGSWLTVEVRVKGK